MNSGSNRRVVIQTGEVRCNVCQRLLGFLTTKYYGSGKYTCAECYFDSWKIGKESSKL